MSLPVIKDSFIIDSISIEESIKRWTLNFNDIESNSNKFYSLELIKAKDGSFFLYSTYGRVGAPNPAKEYRACQSQSHGEIEGEKIVKSKTKKGYVEISLVKVDVGSDVGKAKVSSSAISEETAKKLGYEIKEENKSSLHSAIQAVVKTWFGSIEQFVVDTLDTSKCALGQLSLEQINKGRDLLLEARKLVADGAKDITELNKLSSRYYSNIPMNFGYRRLDANQLRFDSDSKLDDAFDILDSLENAKGVEKVLSKKNAIDEQYRSLKTEMEPVDPANPIFKWIDTLFHKTRASNHGSLGKMKIHNVFKLIRNAEYENYMIMLDKIAKQDQKRSELPFLLKPIWNSRVSEHKEYEELSEKANVLTLFHGTRTPNFPKILSSKLMMRKPGFTVAGAMYDKNGGLYFGFSSKAINYSSSAGSYWSGGSDRKGYVFVSDVILGKSKIATGAYPYTLENIKPCVSVWAKGGYSGVVNDEFIVYTEQQNWLRYIIEFETKV
jgi:poly [ADP-ribose] polymerase 2/3/4